MLDARPRWPGFEESHHPLDGFGRPLQYRLDRSVVAVSHPALDSVSSGALPRRVPEKHPLHAAVGNHPAADGFIGHC